MIRDSGQGVMMIRDGHQDQVFLNPRPEMIVQKDFPVFEAEMIHHFLNS